MANMRGSREYFANCNGHKVDDPRTLFVTCSMAQWFSEPFIQYLKQVNRAVPNVESMTPAKLCAMDPVNVSVHFHKNWTAIFSKFINSKDGAFSKTKDFIWHIEYQAKGPGPERNDKRKLAELSESAVGVVKIMKFFGSASSSSSSTIEQIRYC